MTMHFPRESAKVHPPSLFPYYTSTVKRAPKRPLIILPHTETELTAPASPATPAPGLQCGGGVG